MTAPHVGRRACVVALTASFVATSCATVPEVGTADNALGVGVPSLTHIHWPDGYLPEEAAFVVHNVVEVEAPPEVVWDNVIGFGGVELPPPPEWFFQLGIAYPQRARIEGTGVGAVRYCEFSTGPFVEPITVWDAPRHLAFDVRESPPTMHEWSPYERVHAPPFDELELVVGELFGD